MRRKFIRLKAVLVITFCFIANLQTASAQADRVLVSGNPMLRQSDVDKSIEVFEFFFESTFSDPQRAEYQSCLENAWRNGEHQTIKDIIAFAELQQPIGNADEATRRQTRDEYLPQLIRLLEINSRYPTYSFLLSLYRGTQSDKEISGALNGKRVEKDNNGNNRTQVLKDSGSIVDLVGKWERKQSGQSYVGQNGAYKGSSGNYESYTFFADGRVEYTTLIAVQNYNCRLEAFAQNKGRASISGSDLVVNLSGGTIRRDDSCNRNGNYSKPIKASSKTYDWRIEKDEYGIIQLCLTQENGESFCYRKAKQ
jgi:hypothetical protein